MYIWKCWRCSRARLFYALIVVVVLFVFFTLSMVKMSELDTMRGNPAASIFREPTSAAVALFGSWGSLYVLVWGLILGGSGPGEEFRERTADFLLTRPRRRWYWVWTGWSVGLAEMAASVLLMVAVVFATLLFLRGNIPSWRTLALMPALLLDGALAYGLVYFLTLVTRGGRQGLSYAIGILFIDEFLPAALAHYHLNISFISVGAILESVRTWVTKATGPVHLATLLAWTAVALAFPLAAQFFLERAEV